MVVPVVWSLARQYPDTRITVLSRPFARQLFEGLAPNIGFMEADMSSEYYGIMGLNSLYRRLAAKQFTAVADLHSVLRSEYLRMRFAISRYRVEHIDKHRKGRRLLVAANNKQLVQQPTAFQNYADVFNKLGYPVTIDFHSIFQDNADGRGHLSELPQETCSLLTAITQQKEADEREKAPLIGLAPTAAHKGKTYPKELMEKVIAQLTEKHPEARIFLFGKGSEEDALFVDWCKKFKQCIFVAHQLQTLRQELVLMSHLDVLVSMDSANMHLASLTATPVVSIWGATHPFAGFMGWQQLTENAVQTDISCRPCSIYGQKECIRGDYACLTGIKPETITAQVEKVLDARP